MLPHSGGGAHLTQTGIPLPLAPLSILLELIPHYPLVERLRTSSKRLYPVFFRCELTLYILASDKARRKTDLLYSSWTKKGKYKSLRKQLVVTIQGIHTHAKVELIKVNLNHQI